MKAINIQRFEIYKCQKSRHIEIMNQTKYYKCSTCMKWKENLPKNFQTSVFPSTGHKDNTDIQLSTTYIKQTISVLPGD